MAKVYVDKVVWLSESNTAGTLNDNQATLYVSQIAGLGMTHPGSHTGLTPDQAPKKRYKGVKFSDITASVIVYQNDRPGRINHDDNIRARIHKLNLAGKIPFDAYNKINNPAPSDNTEALINFDDSRDWDTLLVIVKDYFNKNNIVNNLPSWVPRNSGTLYGQDLMVDEVLEKLVKHDKVALNGHTGLSKTMIAAAVIHRLYSEGAFILATTPVGDTLDDITDNFTKYHYPNLNLPNSRNRNTVVYLESDLSRTSIADMRSEADDGSIVVLALTVQDARYRDDTNSNTDEVRDKYQDLLNVHIDTWLRDEKHKEYNGEITGRIFGNIKADKILDLSASINKIRDEYSFDAIVDRGLFWALDYQTQRGTPKIIIEALDGAIMESLSTQDQDRYSVEEGWLPSKMTEMRDGILVSTTAFDSLFTFQYDNDDDKEDNPLSICNDPDLPEVSKKVGLHVLPEGINGIPAQEWITKLADDRNNSPKWNTGKAVFVTPWNWTKWTDFKAGVYTPAEVIESLKTKFEYVIILTHRMWTVGSNIPSIGHVVLWDKMVDPFALEQLFPGRAFRLYEGKTHIKLFVMHPGQRVQDNFCITAKQTAGVRTTKPHPVELLKNINFKKYMNGIGVHSISVSEVFENFNQRIKERLRHEVSVDAINAALDGTPELSSLAELDLENSVLGGSSSVDMTDPNGAKKQQNQSRAAGNAGPARNIDIAKSINAVMIEVPAFAILEKIVHIEDALNHKQIVNMFGRNKIDLLLDAVKTNIALHSLLQDKLTEYHQALGLLGFEEVHDHIFKNTKRKKEAGLVFIDMDSAKSFAEKTISQHGIPKKYNGTIGVVNALSGSVSYWLKKLLPNSNIVCVEKHTYYIDHLTSNGYTVNTWEELDMAKTNQKINYWFLNPPYQKDASGENDDDNKQGSFWYQFLDVALTTPASTKDAKYFVVSPKSVFGAGGFGSNSFKVKKIREHAEFKHIYPDVSEHFPGIGIAIAGYVLDKAKTNSTSTIEGYEATIEVDGKVPVPFEVSPTAKKVLDQCFMVPAKIPFKEKITPNPTDVVLRVNGGRFKQWKKTFVGLEQNTSNNQQGAILPADSIPGFTSLINSKLAEYIFKILGGEKGNSTTVILKHMPVMPDMTVSYSDQEWFDAFGIDKEMQADINKFLQEYK